MNAAEYTHSWVFEQNSYFALQYMLWCVLYDYGCRSKSAHLGYGVADWCLCEIAVVIFVAVKRTVCRDWVDHIFYHVLRLLFSFQALILNLNLRGSE